MSQEYDKLVRDDIPEIIADSGATPVTRTASDAEYEAYLCKKLREEVEEYVTDRDVDELADVLEVLHEIRAFEGVSEQELRDRREQKADERGRFDKRLILERVTD
ncbi:uncharacterized protein Nmag_2976 [Natrialba magadii ATCC 43099]|uniref:Phosphoribosyl-ATP pyrophosphohydrolase n=1 Tax=Natrialba magadii (strain ATCC 43099 / DSM 3394 / CCM 3739 / CIP 104546 / IAM 13178 / JCM 8861 / NBRC 102185 / NCIMB 2190 / MS3) TaxID=547559 RepID=D3T0P9_NATMM|nr:nucleoside triphosphate pyrophosphohydrolase [Natrialba magadii]ADD06528.1 uncharacterized protein Nmag_2976 [Natrialba magadii ATCC 43099]ELY32010.1 hypothetical protein C500_05513 [Natrialba magadii ATCC 43099]